MVGCLFNLVPLLFFPFQRGLYDEATMWMFASFVLLHSIVAHY